MRARTPGGFTPATRGTMVATLPLRVRSRLRYGGHVASRSASTRSVAPAIWRASAAPKGRTLLETSVFRQLFESSPIATLVRSTRTPQVEANPAFQRLLSRTRGDLIELAGIPLSHPDDLVRAIPLTQEVIAGTRDHYRLDERYRHKSGSWIWVRATCTALRDSAGAVEHLVTFIEDISEERRNEEALRESEARFRQLIDNLQDGFWMATANFRELLYWNPVLEHLWGVPTAELARNPPVGARCVSSRRPTAGRSPPAAESARRAG